MKSNFYQTTKIFLFYLKRNRLKMLLWLVILVGLTLMIPPAFESMYPDPAKMTPIIEMSENPAMEAMLGPGDFRQANVGVLFTHEMILFTGIMLAIMNITILAKDTRGDEEDGRTEILNALPIGRQATVLSHLAMCMLLNICFALLTTLGLVSLGIESIDFSGAVIFSVTLGMFGIMIATFTILIAQIVATSTEVVGAGISFLLVMYLLRAFGDVSNEKLSLISPMGWLSRSYAFSENNWWPFWWMLILSIIVVCLSFKLNAMRDMNETLLPKSVHRCHAKWYMKSPLGLQIRLQKSAFIYFSIGLFVLGLSYGSIFGDINDFFENNPLLKSMIPNASGNYAEHFLPQLMLIMAMVSTIPALMTLFKVKKEQDKGYTVFVLSKPLSRGKYLLSFWLLALVNAVVMLFLSGLGLYVGQYYAMKEPFQFDTIITSAIVHVPAILVFIGIGTLIVGWGMRLVLAVYAFLAYTFLVNYLGVLLNIKAWMKDITPFKHIPQLPIEDFHIQPSIVMFIIFVVLSIIGFIGFGKKDL